MAWTDVVTRATNYVVTATNWNQFVNNFKAIGDAWTSYGSGASWTGAGGNPSLGNGTWSGAYLSAGKLTHFRIIITMGSTTTFGTGVWSFALPVTANYTANATPVGGCFLFDTSAGSRFAGISGLDSATTVGVWGAGTSATRFAAGGVPVALGNGDILSISGTYEAA